jgi:hypothetical protein
VLWLVLVEAMALVLIGVAAGIPLAALFAGAPCFGIEPMAALTR